MHSKCAEHHCYRRFQVLLTAAKRSGKSSTTLQSDADTKAVCSDMLELLLADASSSNGKSNGKVQVVEDAVHSTYELGRTRVYFKFGVLEQVELQLVTLAVCHNELQCP
jgi:myosin heavy subunit